MSHLKHFWELVTFKKNVETLEDVQMLCQTEMLKFHSRAVICKLSPEDSEKYRTNMFIPDQIYFCNTSRLYVKNDKIRKVIDFILLNDMKWGIETNLEDGVFLVASWKHW